MTAGRQIADPPMPLVRAILPVWLVTAVWDAVCATALGVFGYGAPAAAVWQGVAVTALGSSAPSSGAARMVAGLAVHTMVALGWAAFFVVVAQGWPSLRRAIRSAAGAVAVASAYGPLIWLVMSIVIIPLATGRPAGFGSRWWIQVAAHIPFVSLPLVFTARRVLRDDES